MTTKKITKKTKFCNIMKDREAVALLAEKGMHCIGCPAAMQETLEEGALAHGLDADELVKELNEKRNLKKTGK